MNSTTAQIQFTVKKGRVSEIINYHEDPNGPFAGQPWHCAYLTDTALCGIMTIVLLTGISRNLQDILMSCTSQKYCWN